MAEFVIDPQGGEQVAEFLVEGDGVLPFYNEEQRWAEMEEHGRVLLTMLNGFLKLAGVDYNNPTEASTDPDRQWVYSEGRNMPSEGLPMNLFLEFQGDDGQHYWDFFRGVFRFAEDDSY